MASFSDALTALAQGRLKADVLLDHMDRILGTHPELLGALEQELADAYEEGLIEASTFAKLKARARQATGIVKESQKGGHVTTPIETNSVGALDIDLDQIILQAMQQRGSGTFAVGTVIKERFVLEEILGAGGMGTVFKARDLLKVEARDRNPFVAIKILNENFRHHRNAFISLQREASRQQKLAHPNIATVFDFDRSGDNVFLTMEYLQGQPLNSYIRRHVRPQGGISTPEALPIIRGLGNALAYAHERDIVHSDFKPANCFLTDAGVVKVLDFGIARVVQNAEDLEKTVHDPTSLGALTPAYASAEMLDGAEPDPRDDIYALGCVAYELLSGKHPYDRKSALLAREKKLPLAPIRKLGRTQMKALQRALALRREDRIDSVNEFLELMQQSGLSSTAKWLTAAVLTAVAIVAYMLWKNA
ncbi:MAG: serine/threonine-protein kinase [Gammaproteobacteria bacterium]